MHITLHIIVSFIVCDRRWNGKPARLAPLSAVIRSQPSLLGLPKKGIKYGPPTVRLKWQSLKQKALLLCRPVQAFATHLPPPRSGEIY